MKANETAKRSTHARIASSLKAPCLKRSTKRTGMVFIPEETLIVAPVSERLRMKVMMTPAMIPGRMRGSVTDENT